MQDPVSRFTGKENLDWVLIPLGSLSSSLRRSVVYRTKVIMQMGYEKRVGKTLRSRRAHYIILKPSYLKILRNVRYVFPGFPLLFASHCVCTKCLDVIMQSYPSLTSIRKQEKMSSSNVPCMRPHPFELSV